MPIKYVNLNLNVYVSCFINFYTVPISIVSYSMRYSSHNGHCCVTRTAIDPDTNQISVASSVSLRHIMNISYHNYDFAQYRNR